MTDLHKAAQQALEALEMSRRFVYADNRPQCDEAIDALRAALAQQDEPVEPVAWECKAGGLKPLTQRQYDAQTAATKRHYTRIAPPQRKPLMDEEIKNIYVSKHWYEIGEFTWGAAKVVARAIERAHGIGGDDGQA